MSDTVWVTSHYPEPYKHVLVYDLHDGYSIGYYDNVTNTFYSIDGVTLFFVSAWQPLPDKPTSTRSLRESTNVYIPKVN